MNTHTHLLEYLEQDTLPDALRARFIRWCVLEQARPALAALLETTALAEAGTILRDADDIAALAQLIHALKSRAGTLAGHGKVGTAAIAALFEFENLIRAARDSVPDASASAFFAARVCGWQALVYEGRHHPARKREAETRAHRNQETILRYLIEGY